ncbi:VIT1/CCC1 transporter family protein [Flavimobilis sp. GY10621]|uniref:VIT1/CCC1 transporter family protein n=1 Tax=Flavimobilis rhizosphaerae TaxID=2775421 RepID=A0ABR9DQ66_9MICO|nr:VIT1/CCC1 family protein [Flavimobilis rhizosphaerae]MBD9699273.1 VIT1/CCC1 transporter family protein [Flavimobilis rhizosphaerae]
MPDALPDPTSAPAEPSVSADSPAPAEPSARDVRRWRHHLADELAEAAIYRDLAAARSGAERDILLDLADAEGRHAEHWRTLLGPERSASVRRSTYSRLLGFGARRFGSVFTLALAQHAESRSAYELDRDATPQMAADERIHEEVVRSLATRGRIEMSGNFRAAVFGLNDGLVSNLALILGIGATGVGTGTVLATGVAGLLAGAMSMGAGEFVSVRSQVELAKASQPSPHAREALVHLDVDANELALVYRARGLDPASADVKARRTLALVARADAAELVARGGEAAAEGSGLVTPGAAASIADVSRAADSATVDAALDDPTVDDVETVGPDAELLGSAWGAAISSFCLFASGAVVPLLPYFFGLSGGAAMIVAAVLVGIVLLGTGATVGVLSGASPWTRALRQIAIGYGAAAVTYLLGLAFGTTLG